MLERLCKAQTDKADGLPMDEVIESANGLGGEFLPSKISEHFPVEWSANECLHVGWHY